MQTDAVQHIKDPLYETLRTENISAFNVKKSARDDLPSFSHGDFRGLDLRGMDARGLDLSHAYFRGADLRGIDFSHSNLEGASIAGAKISGSFFPDRLQAAELLMSLNHGTRMRYSTGK